MLSINFIQNTLLQLNLNQYLTKIQLFIEKKTHVRHHVCTINDQESVNQDEFEG